MIKQRDLATYKREPLIGFQRLESTMWSKSTVESSYVDWQAGGKVGEREGGKE